MTIWLTGLSSSGKTTLAEGLRRDLVRSGFDNVELLDGEAVRERLDDFNYSTDDRNALGEAKAKLAQDLNRQGRLVIVTGIAHHRRTREQVRRLLDRYLEVYLKCDPQICAQRDTKGHYRRAFAGEYENFVGVTEPYQESDRVELTLQTDRQSVEECAGALLQFILDKILAAAASGSRTTAFGPEENSVRDYRRG
ncbi:MAG: adenylyl-sulfate kinase [Candidatus Omnitrophica bacterium]|nr:adenylyl-sulfate kinase [Candidatus Omnitrophota bacterium]